MNLTYEVNGDGYTIFNDGKAWIKQSSYIPYPRDTIEQSAQAHIDAIIADANAPQEPSEIEQLRIEMAQANTELFEMVMLMTGGGAN